MTSRRRLRLNSAISEERVLQLLRSLEARDRKDALQAICEALEAGYQISPQNNIEFASLVAAQRNSTDATVRRWFYKYVGLSRQAAYVPVLLGKIESEDEQTMAWMIGALACILGIQPTKERLSSLDVPSELVERASVFAAYFLPETVDRSVIRHVVSGDSALMQRWSSFLNVRVLQKDIADLTKQLNSASDPEVAEFSVWSASRVAGGLKGTNLQPDEIPDLPAQVRRWAYHAVAADPSARAAYADLIWTARSSEPEERVREGIVQGFARAPVEGGWVEFLQDWARSDESERLRSMIAESMRQTSVSPASTVLHRPVARKNRLTMKGQGRMFGVPKIENSVREMVYLLALDTVSYSAGSDDNQMRMVKAFLDFLANDRRLLALPPESIIPLFTGDGIFLGVRGADNSREPLDVALRLQVDFDMLYKFQMRAGVHSGSVNVLSMSDGSTQMIGHSVNEAARVMAGAPAGGVTMSDAYWVEALHRGREPLVGFELQQRDVTDKHGNTIPCFDIVTQQT